jgi:hypothetical protein
MYLKKKTPRGTRQAGSDAQQASHNLKSILDQLINRLSPMDGVNEILAMEIKIRKKINSNNTSVEAAIE